ncbi:MAG: nitrilase-related carbon-nitrogen hydrolase [Steroidobacteraceae bacterium]
MRKKRIKTPDGTTTLTEELSRRGFLTSALLGGAALGTGAATLAAPAAAATRGNAAIDIHQDGTYTTVPLVKDNIRLGVVQSRVRPLDAANPDKRKKENLDHMLMLIANAQEWNPPSDILFFHEFPITGFSFDWNRKDINRLAIETPGPETAAIGAAARKYGCYIVFGSYVNDADWPGHVISQTTVIGPDGTIIDKHWKARNIMGVFATGTTPIELMTSTVYNCLDRYVELYGADHVIPVTRTPIGNICTSSVQREPELFRALALKGGEIFLRTASGGFSPWDMQATAGYNRVWTAVCNNAISPGNNFFEDIGAGNSAIYSDTGAAVATASSAFEQLVATNIPIKAYRQRHRLPEYAWPLYAPVMDKYVTKYKPSTLTKYQPTDLKDAARYLRDPKNANW